MDAFNYPYRWAQLLDKPLEDQISMLETRDSALEAFFFEDGRCALELPYRWDQIWEGVLAGDSWAISCAEENDRTIEALFARCNCGPTFSFLTTGPAYGGFSNNETPFSTVTDVGSNAFVSIIYTNLTTTGGDVTLTLYDTTGPVNVLDPTVLSLGSGSLVLPATVNGNGVSFMVAMEVINGNWDNLTVNFYGDLALGPSYGETSLWSIPL